MLERWNEIVRDCGSLARTTSHPHWKREVPAYRLAEVLVLIAFGKGWE